MQTSKKQRKKKDERTTLSSHFQQCFCFPQSQKTFVKTETGQEVIKLSPLPKRAKRTYLAMDRDKEVLGYVIPVFRAE